MIKTLLGVAAAATLVAACNQKPAEGDTSGPSVSSSEAPRNEAVDTGPTTDQALTPGANSFTEAQARSAIEGAGYSAVGVLTQNADGIWTGKATKDGAEKTVSVDYKGTVTAS